MRALLALFLLASSAHASYGPFSFNNYLYGSFGSAVDYPFTLVAWVYRDATGWADTTDDRVLCFDDDTTTNNNTACIMAGNGTADQVQAHISSDSGGITNTPQSFSDGTYDEVWVPVAVVYASATSRKICVGSSASCATNTTSRAADDFINVAIGARRNDANGDLPFAGLVAEAAIFGVALSDGEIDGLMTGVGTGPPPCSVRTADCIGYWPLSSDQSSHSDQSGNSGATLSEVGSPTFSSNHPTIVTASANGVLFLEDD